MTDKQLWREMENLANEEKMIIALKGLLLPIMPGEKPKPEFYRE